MAVIYLYSSIKKDKQNIPHKIVARGKIDIPYAYNYHSLSWLDTGTQQQVAALNLFYLECNNIVVVLQYQTSSNDVVIRVWSFLFLFS